MTPLTLVLFDGFKAECTGAAADFATSAARALLAYLAVGQAGPASRESLAAFFWPDKPQKAAYANLRKTLSRAREGLGDSADIIQAGQQSLDLDHGAVEVDAVQFDALLADCARHTHAHTGVQAGVPGDLASCAECRTRLHAAVALYRGEFLRGLTLPDSAPFEEWQLLRREQYRRQAIEALHTLAQHYEARADYDRVRDLAERQIALEPWREEAHAQLMRALAARGERSAALAQYQAYCRIVDQEFGIGPGDELRVLHERIQAGELAPVALSAGLPRHTLPQQLTPFIGREVELADLTHLLKSGSARLITITGPGGMGKTRLAIEAARTRLDDYPDGAYFVSLASIQASVDIAPALCAGMGLSIQNDDPHQSLLHFLAAKRMLLILDNFEHVIAGVDVVLDILHATPNVQIIVTSREQLNVRGETVRVIDGMAHAQGDDGDGTSPAMQLFVHSARRVRADFALTADNASDVAHICTLVEGMPLGIELAAAWCEVLSTAEIAAEIERSVDFLQANWRDAPERQRSLRAVFDWSWQLLSDAEQQALCRLSIFRGGFTRQAAEEIAGASLRVLSGLVHKSLLRRSEFQSPVGRYEMHELIRQFADEKLLTTASETGDAVQETAQRHSDYFLAFVAKQEPMLYGKRARDALATIQAELDNVRQAWTWVEASGRADRLATSLNALTSFYAQTNVAEGTRLYEQTAHRLRNDLSFTLSTKVPSEPERDAQTNKSSHRRALAALLAHLTYFLATRGDLNRVAEVAQEAIGLAQACDDSLIEGQALANWAEALNRMAQGAASQQRAAEALMIARRLKSTVPIEDTAAHRPARVLEADSLLSLSKAYELQWAFQPAADYAEKALAASRQLDMPRYVARSLDRLGEIHRRQGNYEQALCCRLQALSVAQSSGDTDAEVSIFNNLGDVYFCLGEYACAIDLLERGVGLSRAIGSGWLEAGMQETLTHVYLNIDQPERALACAQRARPMIRGYYLNALGLAHEKLGQSDEAIRAFRDALAWWESQPPNAAIAEAYAALARLALAQADVGTAMAWTEHALTHLTAALVADSMQPLLVYWSCYQALKANADPRAEDVLLRAHQLITHLASRIADPALRQSYLSILVHHEIEQAFQRLATAP